jgi:hypothetical protein
MTLFQEKAVVTGMGIMAIGTCHPLGENFSVHPLRKTLFVMARAAE